MSTPKAWTDYAARTLERERRGPTYLWVAVHGHDPSREQWEFASPILMRATTEFVHIDGIVWQRQRIPR